MNLDEIKSILQLMEANKLVEFEYEDDGRRLKLRRQDDRVVTTAVPMAPAAAPLVAAPAATAPAAAPEAARPSNLTEFKSPLVGTFYRSAKPDSDPFVNVGDELNPEKVICIIEAMKVMNEIKAEMGGIVREVLVKNGQAVEFGEPMFLIEKK
ncbi:MAG: acetyl-CoA carboxylase biotin carboxyl carrier protein [Planctomycetota bacterium]|nr:MAG: acetyl-CoA carboxylase biotin carboxyl carrier protein [Planctomycetota bacterium]